MGSNPADMGKSIKKSIGSVYKKESELPLYQPS
jgi:hypothetical protein